MGAAAKRRAALGHMSARVYPTDPPGAARAPTAREPASDELFLNGRLLKYFITLLSTSVRACVGSGARNEDKLRIRSLRTVGASKEHFNPKTSAEQLDLASLDVLSRSRREREPVRTTRSLRGEEPPSSCVTPFPARFRFLPSLITSQKRLYVRSVAILHLSGTLRTIN